ncbi:MULTISPECIES: hypothetical protein [Vibrio]|jgi:hypothetical protein|uniref:hypothetical protein n=1 Tax=Vibrio TaxID=662 RepID=UPI0001B9332A|nr:MULTISPECIES: hypothetical protein [Vibrio]MCG6506924.1 hypothetical protein [Vibrio parahaemolyticus]HDM8033889.1 hypothetical protein [Vibrio fluvialis clinical-1]ADT88625.1 hypothetical protein vfu_B00387 [Vibrio furnissii NCTC 11218]AVH33439.1 hypothetical protein AL475_16105 [Vibrio fluvialis]AVH34038.1 hypothetical protein AL475_19310 [Vibrio fluvialis]
MNFLTSILGKTLWEVLKGLFFQVAWKVILERFASRLVIWGLEKIKTLSTNDVTQETVNDIILSLKGKKLKEVEQWE